MPAPTTTLDLPISLDRIPPEQVAWLAAKSSQTGKPVDEVAKDLIRAAAERDGFKANRARFVPPSLNASPTPTVEGQP